MSDEKANEDFEPTEGDEQVEEVDCEGDRPPIPDPPEEPPENVVPMVPTPTPPPTPPPVDNSAIPPVPQGQPLPAGMQQLTMPAALVQAIMQMATETPIATSDTNPEIIAVNVAELLKEMRAYKNIFFAHMHELPKMPEQQMFNTLNNTVKALQIVKSLENIKQTDSGS